MIKEVWVSINQQEQIFNKADELIDNIGKFTTQLMSTKTMKIFKDLMLRNQELKNNTKLDLYEWFVSIQKKYKTVDKDNLRKIDNLLFLSLYKWKWSKTLDELTVTKYWATEQQYYADMYEFVMGKSIEGVNVKHNKQTLNTLIPTLWLKLSKLLTNEDWTIVKNIESVIPSSLIEDIVNLNHKTEKIAFYEEGIYSHSFCDIGFLDYSSALFYNFI